MFSFILFAILVPVLVELLAHVCKKIIDKHMD